MLARNWALICEYISGTYSILTYLLPYPSSPSAVAFLSFCTITGCIDIQNPQGMNCASKQSFWRGAAGSESQWGAEYGICLQGQNATQAPCVSPAVLWGPLSLLHAHSGQLGFCVPSYAQVPEVAHHCSCGVSRVGNSLHLLREGSV